MTPMIARSRLALALILTGCSSSALGLGDQFLLAAGESASIPEINLRVRFLGVLADSRCPLDVLCVSAGDATVLLEVAPLNGDAKTDTLHTDSDPHFIQVARAELRLVRLDPYPRAARPTAPGEYVVTLVTHPSS
jgi:hypothetical protein